MAVHTSTDVNDMPLFLLGYLYFCVAIDPSVSLSIQKLPYLNIYIWNGFFISFQYFDTVCSDSYCHLNISLYVC